MKGIRGISQLSVRIQQISPVCLCVGAVVDAAATRFPLGVIFGTDGAKNSGSCPIALR